MSSPSGPGVTSLCSKSTTSQSMCRCVDRTVVCELTCGDGAGAVHTVVCLRTCGATRGGSRNVGFGCRMPYGRLNTRRQQIMHQLVSLAASASRWGVCHALIDTPLDLSLLLGRTSHTLAVCLLIPYSLGPFTSILPHLTALNCLCAQDNWFVLCAVLRDQFGILLEEGGDGAASSSSFTPVPGSSAGPSSSRSPARPTCPACARTHLSVTLHKIV